jgi:hypothetical protein
MKPSQPSKVTPRGSSMTPISHLIAASRIQLHASSITHHASRIQHSAASSTAAISSSRSRSGIARSGSSENGFADAGAGPGMNEVGDGKWPVHSVRCLSTRPCRIRSTAEEWKNATGVICTCMSSAVPDWQMWFFTRNPSSVTRHPSPVIHHPGFHPDEGTS